ncbi:NUAK family SNF1-like kinase 1 [Poeciliopsis prolifica]|uniref:NUAK family SNF1-like kinase 1 n=1 Tax=Poeciliopsis prolifica TaxID=188132 RepID=UPI0024134414|nr:NUAK family SNF1-like kinase 1 [Poeciliopsis prolifica]
MGRRESHGRGAMNPSHLSELGRLQDSASSGHRRHQQQQHQQQQHGEQLRGTDSGADRRQRKADLAAAAAPVEVKKHQHKHNLKHRYEVMETLGKGTYGKVKKAVERASMRTVAIKSIRKERITDDLDRIHIQREIEITSSLRHSNIIRFHEVFESRDKIVIVMEYASRGELYDYIQERKRLPETEARSIFRQIASAVHYCHKNGVVHRDLKLENILLDKDLNVKLADFGLSNNFQTGSLLQTYCGSPLYAAPEIVKGLPYTGPEVDCWALGVLLYALVYSSMPFDGANHKKLTEQISQGRYCRPNPPSDACALIDWLLTVRADERATIEDVAHHWWVNWGYDESVCDCPTSPHQECPSPLLARYIDWQNQVGKAGEMTSDPGSRTLDSSCRPQLTSNSFYFSLPFKNDCGGGGARVREGASNLRKSRKENAIPQTTMGASTDIGSAGVSPAPVATSTPERRKPKGILKHQRSLDSVFHNSPKESSSQMCNTLPHPHRTQTLVHTHVDVLSKTLPHPPTFSQPSSKMPKKGILKSRGSGYNLAPDRNCSGERVQESDAGQSGSHKTFPTAEESPNMRTEAVRRRKGILKRNGKFSRSLDLTDNPNPSDCLAPATFPEALQQLLRSSGDTEGRRSRPSSVISEDSLFSSDSFDLLDLSTQSQPRIFSQGRRHSGGGSEEDEVKGNKKGQK